MDFPKGFRKVFGALDNTLRLKGCFTAPPPPPHPFPLNGLTGWKPVGVNYTMKRGNVIGALLDAHERHLRLWSSFQWAFMPVKQSIVTGNKLLQMNRPVMSRLNKKDHLILLESPKRTDCEGDECKSILCWTSSPKKL